MTRQRLHAELKRNALVEPRSVFDDVRSTGKPVPKLHPEASLESGYAQQIVDVGRRELARKLHPDVSGNGSEMVRVNAAAEQLKKLLKGTT